MDDKIELGNLVVENHEDISQNSPDVTTNHNQVSEDYQDTEDNITAKDICLVSIVGLVMPSVDQGSDYYEAGILINHEHECRHRDCDSSLTEEEMQSEELRISRYGYAMLVPIILMTICSLRQWWRLEKGKYQRLLTFPLVLLQLYPQYRAVRILYLGLMKKRS